MKSNTQNRNENSVPFQPLDLMAVGTRRASARSARSSKHKTATDAACSIC
jgi:hypothetical protein